MRETCNFVEVAALSKLAILIKIVSILLQKSGRTLGVLLIAVQYVPKILSHVPSSTYVELTSYQYAVRYFAKMVDGHYVRED